MVATLLVCVREPRNPLFGIKYRELRYIPLVSTRLIIHVEG